MARMGDSGSVINCANRATDVSILDWRATPAPVPPESPSDKFMYSPFLCQAYTNLTWEARGRGRNTRNRGDTGSQASARVPTRDARVALLKKSLPIDRPKKQAR